MAASDEESRLAFHPRAGVPPKQHADQEEGRDSDTIMNLSL